MLRARELKILAPLLNPAMHAGGPGPAVKTEKQDRFEVIEQKYPVRDVPHYFEQWSRDFNGIRGGATSSAEIPPFHIVFTGQRRPGHVDIRAGSFHVERNPDASCESVALAISNNEHVGDWEYRCAGDKEGRYCRCKQEPEVAMVVRVEIFDK